MKTSIHILLVGIFLLLPIKVKAQTTFKVTSAFLTNTETKAQMEWPVDDGTTFLISRQVIILKKKGKTIRTFYAIQGYSFGFRSYATPATYDDQEYCSIGLVKSPGMVIIIYKYLHFAVTYNGYFTD